MASHIKHRIPNFNFDASIDKHWHGDSAFKTHFLNSLTLCFPIGEKFFIRSIQAVMSQINKKDLRSRALNFIKQEAQHSKEHHKFFEVLEAQGYRFEPLLEKLDSVVKGILEPLGKDSINLSVTSGLEHLTALFSEISLKEEFMKDAPDNMRELFDWHAAEEIEHRSVAFDVYQEVSGNFPLRIMGLLYAYSILTLCSGFFTSYLLHQDGLLFNRKTLMDFTGIFFTKEKLFFKAIHIFFRYLDPNFHPDRENLDDLANSIFDGVNLNVVGI